MRHMPSVPLLVALALLLPAAPLPAQSSSASFTLNGSTTNDGGDACVSSGYRLTASLGQESTIGTSSSPRFVLQSGFWSFVGSGLVPVILTVDPAGSGTPGNLDLAWSGNNAPYDLYESADCTAVFGGYLDQSASNDYLDVTPLPDALVCYRVLPTAPGPAPPPSASTSGAIELDGR